MSQRSSLETHCLGFLIGASHIGTFYLTPREYSMYLYSILGLAYLGNTVSSQYLAIFFPTYTKVNCVKVEQTLIF